MSRKPTTAKRTAGDELEALFRPRSVAVVGASSNQHSQGYEFVQGLVEIGFPGPIYPVNPKLDKLFKLKAYPRLEDIPGQVDFVISAVPAGAVLDLVEGAKAKGTKLIHLYTARFSETGRKDAAELEREVQRRIKEAGIRVIGPNCMGVYYPKGKLTFEPGFAARPGNIGVLSQSGSHCFRIIGRGLTRGLGFSKVISYGNALDLTDADFLDHFAVDPDTEAICVYVEGLRDGKRFFEALRRAAAKKPVVILKGGRTPGGQNAASSHTAALASEMTIWHAAVRQAGALEVTTINELIDMAVLFRSATPVKGNRVAVMGGAGGEMVESADLCQEAGLELPTLTPAMRKKLRKPLPHAWDWVGNPVDGSILGGGRAQAFAIMEMMAASPNFDAIIANMRGIEHALGRNDGGKMFRQTMNQAKRLGIKSGKPAILIMGEPEAREQWRRKAAQQAREELSNAGVALFPDISSAANAMGRYVNYMAQRQNGG